jgi:hypothetical protein
MNGAGWCSIVVIAISVVALLWHIMAQPPPRHHIYWCYLTVNQNWQGFVVSHNMSLPCMYRTNNPVSV